MIQAAKIIGTGLATTGLIGAGVGIGVVFGALIFGSLIFVLIDRCLILFLGLFIFFLGLFIFFIIKKLKNQSYNLLSLVFWLITYTLVIYLLFNNYFLGFMEDWIFFFKINPDLRLVSLAMYLIVFYTGIISYYIIVRLFFILKSLFIRSCGEYIASFRLGLIYGSKHLEYKHHQNKVAAFALIKNYLNKDLNLKQITYDLNLSTWKGGIFQFKKWNRWINTTNIFRYFKKLASFCWGLLLCHRLSDIKLNLSLYNLNLEPLNSWLSLNFPYLNILPAELSALWVVQSIAFLSILLGCFRLLLHILVLPDIERSIFYNEVKEKRRLAKKEQSLVYKLKGFFIFLSKKGKRLLKGKKQVSINLQMSNPAEKIETIHLISKLSNTQIIFFRLGMYFYMVFSVIWVFICLLLLYLSLNFLDLPFLPFIKSGFIFENIANLFSWFLEFIGFTQKVDTPSNERSLFIAVTIYFFLVFLPHSAQ